MIQVLKLRLGISIIIALFSLGIFAQEEDDSGKLPVRSPFEAGMLVDMPTIVSPLQGGLEINILHRLCLINEGTSTLFGIYVSSAIKLGLTYGITDKIAIGIGTNSFQKLQDINCKVALLRQNRSGSMPVSLSYYGNFAIDTRSDNYFGPVDSYRFIHRLSYFSEFILARKFNDIISLQVAPNFSYFNAVLQGYENIYIGMSAGGRAKLFSSSSIIVEYDHTFTKTEFKESKPNVSIGYEIGTATHCFQIFATTYENISPQHNVAFHNFDMAKKEFLLGFNVTVRL